MERSKMKLILISPESGTSELDLINNLFDLGLEYFHIRKPHFSEEELREYILGISEKYYQRLIIHSFHHLALEFPFYGIHFTEKEKLEGKLYDFSGSHSASFHSVEELQNCRIRYNYVFLSPIFNSISKDGYLSGFKKEELMTSLPLIQQRVVALGGVDLQNVHEVKEMGFSGVAVLGAVWNSKSPAEKFAAIRDEVERL